MINTVPSPHRPVLLDVILSADNGCHFFGGVFLFYFLTPTRWSHNKWVGGGWGCAACVSVLCVCVAPY